MAASITGKPNPESSAVSLAVGAAFNLMVAFNE